MENKKYKKQTEILTKKKTMSQPLRVENPDISSLITARCQNSRLWFVNNSKLEKEILFWLAKYTNKYSVELYAFALMGNHFHIVARFPLVNRAAFCREFNKCVAIAVRYHVPNFEGGTLFERRYAEQALPLDKDVEDKIIYCALQAVSSGLAKNIRDYPGYNSFFDAVAGKKRTLKRVNRAEYNQARRYNKNVSPKDFLEVEVLSYAQLINNYELKALCEKKRLELVAKWKKQGKRFPSRAKLRQIIPGSKPKTTKKSSRNSHRPHVLSRCPLAAKEYLKGYFSKIFEHKRAVKKLYAGQFDVAFPAGTYCVILPTSAPESR